MPVPISAFGSSTKALWKNLMSSVSDAFVVDWSLGTTRLFPPART